MTVGHRLHMGSASRRLALPFVLTLVFALVPAGVAFADHFENVTELEASDAIEAAVEWSEFTFDESTDVALGRDDIFADNLASSVIQGISDAPLLLTDTDELSDEVLVELERLGAAAVHILGGEEAISEEVEAELVTEGYEVHRDAGTTRIETAIDIAQTHAADATEGLLVRAFGTDGGDDSRAWADALAAGGWAAAEEMPVFLTQSNELNDNLENYLEDSDITSLTIIGGVSAISAAVETELESMGIDVTRVSGANRAATAVEIAEARGFDSAADAEEVILVEGEGETAWAGGFAAAAYSAMNDAPIVLAAGDNIPPETETFLAGANDDDDTTETETHLICGPLVNDAACDEAAEIMGFGLAAHTNETLAVTPEDDAVNSVSTVGDNEGAREYEVSGLDDEQEYNIFLFRSEDLETDEDGNVTFDDADGTDEEGNDEADFTATDADIETVNGLATGDTNGSVLGVSPQNGVITFVVDSTVAEEVVPVIVVDEDDDATDADPDVDLAADDTPTEDFGTGGEKKWLPDEAAAGASSGTDAEITEVNQDENFFVADGVLYEYDDNDDFFVSEGDDGTCIPVSMTTFERELSEGDETSDAATFVYSQDEDASSAICIDDLSPEEPTNVVATATGNDVTVTWTEAAEADGYNIYRAEDPTPLDACPEDGGTADIDEDDYTLVGSVDEETDEFTDEDVADGTYCYTVTTVLGEEETDPAESAGAVDQAETPVDDTTAPAGNAQGSVVDEDTGFNDIADNGDVLVVFFDENVVLGDNPALMVSDGTDAATIDESNATFEVDGDQLTVTLTDTLEDADGDTLALPLTLTNSRDIEDASGNRATFADTSFEDNGPELMLETSTCDTGDTTCTIEFNEAVNEAAAEAAANYEFDPGAAGAETILSIVLGADDRTITITFSGALDGDELLGPDAGNNDVAPQVVDDDGQGATQNSFDFVA